MEEKWCALKLKQATFMKQAHRGNEEAHFGLREASHLVARRQNIAEASGNVIYAKSVWMTPTCIPTACRPKTGTPYALQGSWGTPLENNITYKGLILWASWKMLGGKDIKCSNRN